MEEKTKTEQTIQELFNSLSGFNDTAISKEPIKGITRNEFSNEIIAVDFPNSKLVRAEYNEGDNKNIPIFILLDKPLNFPWVYHIKKSEDQKNKLPMTISDLEHKESGDAFDSIIDSLALLDGGQKLRLIEELKSTI